MPKVLEITEEQRQQVKSMAGFGMSHRQISSVIGVAPGSLRKFFREELDVGDALATAQVAQSLFSMAVGAEAVFDGNGNMIAPYRPPQQAAAIFWMKARAGWSEKIRVQPIPEEERGTIDVEALSLEALVEIANAPLIREEDDTVEEEGYMN